MSVREVPKITEHTMDWTMQHPCENCPFLKSTPPEKKGLVSSIEAISLSLMGDGDILHSCHKTDDRVTDGGFAEGYEGPLKHCAGFMMMCHKSKLETGPMLRARARKKLDLRNWKGLEKVHTFRELLKVLMDWAKSGEEQNA